VKNAKKNVMARRKSKAPVKLSNASTRRQVSGPRGTSNWMQRVSGTESLGAVFELDRVQSFDFCQLDLHGTRTGNLFKIYEKHFVHSLKYRFEPTLGASAIGQISMAFEHDVTDLPPTEDTAIAHFASFADNLLGPICQVHTLEVKNRRLPDGAWQHMTLYNDLSDGLRESCFGSLRTFVVGTGLSSSTSCGTLYVDYDVTFISPEVATGESVINAPTTLNRFYITGSGTASDISPSMTAMVDNGVTATPQLTCYDTAHSFTYNMDPGDLYCGEVVKYFGCVLKTPQGEDVPLGTKIFWKPSTQEFDLTTGQGSIHDVSPIIGWISTAMGVAGLMITFVGAVDTFMDVANVRQLRIR